MVGDVRVLHPERYDIGVIHVLFSQTGLPRNSSEKAATGGFRSSSSIRSRARSYLPRYQLMTDDPKIAPDC